MSQKWGRQTVLATAQEFETTINDLTEQELALLLESIEEVTRT